MKHEKQLLDRILATKTLATAEDVVRQAGLERCELDGRAAGRARGASRIRLEPGPDLRPFDQFSVWVYATAGAAGRLSIEVAMNTVTEGLDWPDKFHSGVATAIDWVGWRECVFPYENFLIYGCPDGWNGVAHVEIYLDVDTSANGATGGDESIVAVGDILLVQRERRQGPRLTDAGLFNELDLTHAGLETVQAAMEAGALDRAKDALLVYFRGRVEPWHSFDAAVAPNPDFDRASADRICEHVVDGLPLPREFDWRINPIGYLEWMHRLNRHFFLETLIQAYQKTGDEKYAVKLDYFLDTWMTQNPEPVGHNGGGDPAWETLSTSIRPRQYWLYIWYALKDSPAFRPETRIRLLKSFWAHAEHLTRYEGYHNNWFIVESETIAVLGVLFPEFKRAETWRTRGYARLAAAVAEQVYPDGAQYEISSGYHAMSGRGFELPYELALHNGLPIDPLLKERLEGMYAYTAWTVRPDFSHPSLNDSGGVSGGQAAWAVKGAELFGRPDLHWVGTRGREGTVPTVVSHAFLDAGVYVMRSGWEVDAKYLVLDAGPYGAAHQHEDKLSFEFCYGPDPLIVDPGISSYLPDAWTAYYRHTRAHNTIMIDGGGQERKQTQGRDAWIRSVRDENVAHLGRGLDYVISRYDAGYEGVAEPIVHERAVLFVRNDFFLVLDRVTGEGMHEVDALFHFMPIRVQLDKRRVRTNREGLKNVELAPLDFDTRLTPRLVTGAQAPVQGWVADRENKPGPCAVYGKKHAALPLECGWVLAPFDTGRSAGLRIRRVKAEGGHAFALSWKNGARDLLFWRWCAEGLGSFSGFTTDARGAVVRRDPSGQITYTAAVEGSFLKGRGVDLTGTGLVE